jgi:hypothetical protein
MTPTLRDFYRWGGRYGLGKYVKLVWLYLTGVLLLFLFVVALALLSRVLG